MLNAANLLHRLKLGGTESSGTDKLPSAPLVGVAIWLVAAVFFVFAPFIIYFGLAGTAQEINVGVVKAMQSRLSPEMAQRSIPEPLVTASKSLLLDSSLGVSFLTIRNADRVILVSDGSHEDSFAWLGKAQARKVRGYLYSSGSFDRDVVLRNAGEIVGYVEYGIGVTAVLLSMPMWLWLVFLFAVLAAISLVRYFSVASEFVKTRAAQRKAVEPKAAVRAIATPKATDSGAKELMLSDQLGIGYVSVNAAGEIVHVNTNAARLLGFEVGRLPGQNLESLLVMEDNLGNRVELAISNHLRGKSRADRRRAWLRRKNGKLVGVEMHLGRTPGARKSVAGMMFWEISADLSAQRDNAERAAVGNRLLDTMHEAVLLIDASGQVLLANPRAAGLFGEMENALKAKNADELLPSLFAEQKVREMHNVPADFVASDGAELNLIVSCVAERWQSKNAFIVVISKTAQIETAADAASAPQSEFLPAMGYRDQLTGLASRRQLMQRISRCFSSDSVIHPCMLLLIDIRACKRLNLEFGRDVGDQALAAFGQKLAHAIELADTVVHMGGDEFAILITSDAEIDDQQAYSAAQVLLKVCSQPIQIGELELVLHADIGISIAPLDAQLPNDLLHHAEAALYTAKAAGNNQPMLYAPGMHRVPVIASESVAFHRALAASDIELQLQPLCRTNASSGVAGAFAYPIWESANGSLEGRALWEHVESLGYVREFSAWCLRRVAREHASWRDLALASVPVFIAMPHAVLDDPDFERAIDYLKARYRLPEDALVLSLFGDTMPQEYLVPGELRTAITSEIDLAVATTAEFIWLPDTVVSALPESAEAMASAKRAGAYARTQGKTVIAGPVENDAQRSALTALGASLVYGPFVGQVLESRPFARHLARAQTQAV